MLGDWLVFISATNTVAVMISKLIIPPYLFIQLFVFIFNMLSIKGVVAELPHFRTCLLRPLLPTPPH